jgi:DNA polymerase-1
LRPIFESEKIEKTGHNLKSDLRLLREQGISVGGKLFDTMIAHSLIEPDMRHALEYLAETYLGYSPMVIAGDEVTRLKTPASTDESSESRDLVSYDENAEASELYSLGSGEPDLLANSKELESPNVVSYNGRVLDYAMERADLVLQLRAVLAPLLKEKSQERVFYEIESPLSALPNNLATCCSKS